MRSKKSLKITVEIDNQIPLELIGDPLRISQIVNNLISNAIKFKENGFVNIQLVLIEKLAQNTSILVRFMDSGMGIPEQKKCL